MAVTAGQILSHYHLVAPLGAGGMGEVWLAEDTTLKRKVALKVLPAGVATDLDRLARFQREAEAVAALSHPNIVTIYSIEQDSGVRFLTMELVEGPRLDQMTPRGGLPLGPVLEIGATLADALAASHEKGIIHRDLKPANIMLAGRERRVKVLDFGLAKLREESAPDGETTTAALSGEGRILGTVAYMSPEQAEGKPVDARSDLFSLGIVLYELATGERPFTGETSLSVLSAIVRNTPKSVTELRGDLPKEFARIIRQCLQKDPEERYQTAKDLRNQLRALKGDLDSGDIAASEVGVRAVPARRPARLPVRLAAALGAVVIALAGWYLLTQRSPAPSWKNATFTQLTNQPGQEYYPSLSPDGKSFVFASRASGNWDIYLQRVGGRNPINLTNDSPADDTEPSFSPDGGRIAFRSERERGGIYVMGATGESAKRLTDFGYHPAWSPDGQQIVCATGGFVGPEGRIGTQRSQLFVIPAGASSESSNRRLITAEIEDAVQPNWSPDGQRIAFWGLHAGNRDVWTVPASGGAPVQVTQEPATDWHPVWSPDGKYLYFLSDRGGSMNLWRIPIDETSGRVLGPPDQVTTPSTYTLHFSLARDGRRLSYVNQVETGNIYKVDFDPVREKAAGPASPVTHGSWLAWFPDVSPDGQWVAFNTFRRPEDLFVSRVDGSGLRQLTDDEYRDRHPRWSPDGKRLAFYSDRSGAFQIWTISPDGSGLQQLTGLTDRQMVSYPMWSPDGARLAFSGADRPTAIMEIGKPWDERSLESLPPMESPNEWFQAFSWSPDGRRLAGHRRSAGGVNGISVYSLDSRQYQHFTDFGWAPRWLGDSRRLIFSTAGGPAIFLLDTRSGKVREILSVAPNGVYTVVPSRDDRWIYFGLGSNETDVWLMSRK